MTNQSYVSPCHFQPRHVRALETLERTSDKALIHWTHSKITVSSDFYHLSCQSRLVPNKRRSKVRVSLNQINDTEKCNRYLVTFECRNTTDLVVSVNHNIGTHTGIVRSVTHSYKVLQHVSRIKWS